MGDTYEFRLRLRDRVYVLPRAGAVEIGREADCDIQLDEDLVSRRHARISVEADRLVFTDLGSSNGSRVNDVMVEEPITLRPGDRIRIGLSILEVEATPRRRYIAPTLRLVNCKACGAIVSDEMQFCVQCGTPLPARKRIELCSVCNEPLQPAASECASCGSPVRSE